MNDTETIQSTFFACYVDDRLVIDKIRDGGELRLTPVLFMDEAEAKKHYDDVRPVRLHNIRKRKGRTEPA